MSAIVRTAVYRDGVLKKISSGDNPAFTRNAVTEATDANKTIAAATVAGGLYLRSIGAARTDTFATGALLDAEMPDLNVGDQFELVISNQAAFVLTLAAGVGNTIQSTKTTVPASGTGRVLFTKTGAGTFDIYVL